MPKTIRIQTDAISAELAAQRLRQEGISAQVISDSDWVGIAGTPMAFSLLVPADYEPLARKVLAEVSSGGGRGPDDPRPGGSRRRGR